MPKAINLHYIILYNIIILKLVDIVILMNYESLSPVHFGSFWFIQPVP
jgi:hypothetical protein